MSSSQFELTMETVCNDNDESLAHGHFAERFAVKLSIQVSSSSQFELTMETVCNDNDESLAVMGISLSDSRLSYQYKCRARNLNLL